ncbi:MAG: helix-turn-helix transcriptional regulator [Nitrospinae bacterium]|nr:helix-turn-helix transcriptional regulator [Nitrospinota bacterium]
MQEKNYGTAKHLGTRLREWRKTLHLKSYELAKLIHISQGSLSDIENNKSLPSADTIAKLYQHTQLNIIWLLTGRGPMNRTKAASEEGDAASSEELLPRGQDPTLKELVEKVIRIYQRGDPEKKAHLKGFLSGADPGF